MAVSAAILEIFSVKEWSLSVLIAVVLFSMTPCMHVIGMWIEMPLLVAALPEGCYLPLYFTMMNKVIDIGPTVYNLCKRHKHEIHLTTRCMEVVVMAIKLDSATNMFLLVFSWDVTSMINWHTYSTVILTEMMLAATTSCITTLIFMKYLSRFQSPYSVLFYAGNCTTHLVFGVIGLLQDAIPPSRCLNITNHTYSITQEISVNMINTTNTVFLPKAGVFS